MIVGVSGYGATGASACIDLIKEFENIQSFYSSFEFQLLQQPDGLCDLKYFLTKSGRRLDNCNSIHRFQKNISNPRSYNIQKATDNKFISITNEYLQKLVTISWNGRSAYEPYDMRPFYDKLSVYKLGRYINKALIMISPKYGWPMPHKQLYSCVSSDNYDSITKEYLKTLFEAAHFDFDKPILVEQIFNTAHPTEGMEFFDDAKAIIVDRDPRDVFIISNVTMKSVCGFMPNTGDAEAFVKYYRSLHSDKVVDKNVLYVQYEDLIFKYDAMVRQLEIFLGLRNVSLGEHFKPQHSINNTQQYKQHPEVAQQIAYIEKELQEYLYPFDEMYSALTFEPVKMKSFDRQIEAERQVRRKIR